jgi:hypothetical protein
MLSRLAQRVVDSLNDGPAGYRSAGNRIHTGIVGGDDETRIITARKVNKQERKAYADGKL